MEKKVRFIKISENKIFITPSDSILFQQTNFPKSSFGFRTNKEVYWQVELKNYDKTNNSIDIVIVDYHPNNFELFNNQTQKKSVKSLEFESVDWNELEPLLAWYKAIDFEKLTNRSSLSNHLKETRSNRTEISSSTPRKNNTGIDRTKKTTPKISIPEEKLTWEHPLNFKFYFKDAKFNDGYVSFEKYVDSFNRYIDFKIYNNKILAEYDLIKFYFPKVFNGRKKFSVSAKTIFKGNKIIEVISNSEEIESINEKLIDRIKKWINRSNMCHSYRSKVCH